MATLLAAYLVAAVALCAYSALLVMRTGRLRHRLQRLQSQIGANEETEPARRIA